MPLADDIRALRDRSIADLTAAHDYYFQAEVSWGLARQAVGANAAQAFQNPVTGTTVNGIQLAAQSSDYNAGYLAEATFQQFLSLFEVFVGDLLRLWLAGLADAAAAKVP